MQEELEQRRTYSLSLCDQLLAALEENRNESPSFFTGELYKAYATATDKAKNKVKIIKSKIRNL